MTTYERIADTIEQRIRAGDLAAGDLAPSTRAIVAEHGVAMATASRVIAELRSRGLVEVRRGVGAVVTRAPSAAELASPTDPRSPALGRVTADTVAQTAIRIADAEGLAALSMRRIATDVGVPTMSLYRHVPGRDALIIQMLDVVYGEVSLPHPLPAEWRPRAEAVARAFWALFSAHPWAAHAMSMTRPQPVPHGVAFTEALLGGFADVPDLDERMHLTVTLFQFVRGVATGLEPAAQARQDSGISDEEWMDHAKPSLQALTDDGQHPELAAITGSEIDLTLESLFEFGLARLLDGYELHLARWRP